MSGSTGDAICKVQKIALTMNLASSLAVHASENCADKKLGGLILLHGVWSHDDYIGDMIGICQRPIVWRCTRVQLWGKGSWNFRLAHERSSRTLRLGSILVGLNRALHQVKRIEMILELRLSSSRSRSHNFLTSLKTL